MNWDDKTQWKLRHLIIEWATLFRYILGVILVVRKDIKLQMSKNKDIQLQGGWQEE